MIEGIILILISTAVLIAGIYKLKEIQNIKLIGEETEGVIFDKESSGSGETTVTYPIVRFITRSQEWITEKSTVSIIPLSYKTGKRVRVVYDPSNPREFSINSKSTFITIKLLITAAVILLLAGGYLLVSDLSH